MEWFRELSPKQKLATIIFSCIGIAAIIIAFATTSSGGDDEGEEVYIAPIQAPSVSTPAEEPLPSEDSTQEAAPPSPTKYVTGGDIIVKVGKNELSVSESRKALGVAEAGLTEFLVWKPKETLDSRQKRIDKYFSAKSPTRLYDPALESEASTHYDTETKISMIATHGEVKSISVAGGNEKLFRANINAEYRSVLTDVFTGKADSSVRIESPKYMVDLVKEKGAWKILNLSKS